MEVNDELIACFVDGTATEEECCAVRQYLLTHPEERVAVLHLMDMNANECLDWTVDDEPSRSSDEWNMGSMVADMAVPAAAFVNVGSFSAVSMIRRVASRKKHTRTAWGGSLDSTDLDERWEGLCEECFGDR